SGSSTRGGELGGGLVIQTAVRPAVVVVATPRPGQALCLEHVVEHLGVQQFPPQPAVEALSIAILPRRTRSNVQGANVCRRQKLANRQGYKIRAVIAAKELLHA